MRDPRIMVQSIMVCFLVWWILSTHSGCPSISTTVDSIHKIGLINIGSPHSLLVHANISRVALNKEIADYLWDDSSSVPFQPGRFYDLRFNKRVNFILDLPDVEVRVEAQKIDLPDNSEEAFITISTKRDEKRKAKIIDDKSGWRNKLTTVGFFCKEMLVIIRVDINADLKNPATTFSYSSRPTHLRVNVEVKRGDYSPQRDGVKGVWTIHQPKPQPPFAQEDPKISLIRNDFRSFEKGIVGQMPIRNAPVQAGLLTTANHNQGCGTSRHDLGSLSTQIQGSDTLTREAWQELEREKEEIDKISKRLLLIVLCLRSSFMGSDTLTREAWQELEREKEEIDKIAKWLLLIVLCLGSSFMVWILLLSLKYPWNKVEPVMEYAKLFVSAVTIPVCIYTRRVDSVLGNLKDIPFKVIQFILMRLRNFDIKSYKDLQGNFDIKC